MEASRTGFQGLCLARVIGGPNCETDLSTVLDEWRSKEDLRVKFPKDSKPHTSNYATRTTAISKMMTMAMLSA